MSLIDHNSAGPKIEFDPARSSAARNAARLGVRMRASRVNSVATRNGKNDDLSEQAAETGPINRKSHGAGSPPIAAAGSWILQEAHMGA